MSYQSGEMLAFLVVALGREDRSTEANFNGLIIRADSLNPLIRGKFVELQVKVGLKLPIGLQ